MSGTALLILIACCGATGLVLAVIGFRGRRINDHPVCRGCSFDLIGVYPEASVCPECGRSLDRRRGVLRGARERRPAMLAIGASLLLVFVGGGGFLGWLSVSGTGWYPSAPDWYLEAAAGVGSSARRAPAVGELAARMGAGNLSEGRANRLLRRGLAIQADPSRPWLVEWGDLIDAADVAGLLSAVQRESYLRHVCDISIAVRDRVRAGEEARVSIEFSPARCGSATQFVFSMRGPRISLDGEVVQEAGAGSSRFTMTGMSGWSATHRTVVFDAPPREVALEVETSLEIGTMFAPGWEGVVDPVELSGTFKTSVTVVADDVGLIDFLDRPELAEDMRSGIQINLSVSGEDASGTDLHGDIRGSDLPVGYGFDLYIVDMEGVEHRWARMFLPADAHHSYGSGARVEARLGETVDVILRASEEAVLQQSESEESWSGELRFESVPLTRSGG